MHITVMKSKISYATVTATELFYEGSITIDEDIMDRANIREYEQVQVVNLNNGERIMTYVIKGERGSKQFCINGPAARRAYVGDQIMVISYASIDSKNESIIPIVFSLK